MLGEVDLWHRLAEAIAVEMNSRCDAIVSGHLDGIERYRFETGFVRGLHWVLDRAQEIVAAAPPNEAEPEEGEDDAD
jgi:predicted phosphohydrolase